MERGIGKPLRGRWIVLVLVILFFVCISDFLFPQTMVCHDTEFHVIRIRELAKSVEQGIWNPAVFSDLYDGFGYGIPLFYSNTMLYMPTLLVVMGVPVLSAYKILLCTITLTTILLTYVSALSISKDRLTALLAAVFYTGSAYFAADLIERASIGELFGYAIFPVVLLGIYRSCYGEYRNNLPLILGFFLTAISHILSLIMFSFFFLLFILCNAKRYIGEPKRLLSIGGNALVAFSLAAYFLLPLMEQYANARFFSEWHFAHLNPATTAVRIYNLFITIGPMGYDYTPSIGLPVLGILIIWFFRGKKEEGNLKHMRNLCLLFGLVCLFMATRFFPYEALDPAFNIIQFPWRFFLPGTMFFAFAGAVMLREIVARKKWSALAVTAICLFLCSVQFLSISIPTYVEHSWASMLDTHANLTDTDADFIMSDENYLHINNTKDYWYYRTHAINISDPNVKATGGRENGTYTFQFTGNGGRTSVVELPLVYYYGYQAVSDSGEELPVFPGEHGLVALAIPDHLDSGKVDVHYQATDIQRLSPFLSLFAGIGLAVCTALECGKRRKRNPA